MNDEEISDRTVVECYIFSIIPLTYMFGKIVGTVIYAVVLAAKGIVP